MSSLHPDIEILFTKPTKILGVMFLQKVSPMTFLLTKVISVPLHLLVKLFCGWFFWKISIKLPQLFFNYYIRKFQFRSWTVKFFINNLFSQIFGLLVKLLQFGPLQLHLLVFFYTHGNIKLCPIRKKSTITHRSWCYTVAWNPGGSPQAPRAQWSTT